MEAFEQYLTTNLPDVIKYFLMAVAYFLLFLYRAKVNGTKRDLNVMFKEKTAAVVSSEQAVREEFTSTKAEMARELAEAKAQYKAAVDEIADLKRELRQTKNAVNELVKEVNE